MYKSIFATRFKECCKEKGYTQEDVANKPNITIDGLKHHLRSGKCTPPPVDLVLKIANILDVDAEYLINEQRICKHYKSETICDVTMLNEESAEVLRYLDINSVDILNEILTHSKFEYMLAQIVHFVCFSRNEEYISYDMGDGSKSPIDTDTETQKALKKYIVTETFSKILDDIYDFHSDTEFEIIKLKDLEIDMIASSIEENDDKEFIDYLIESFQQKLKKLDASDPLCSYSSEYFIQNIASIMKARK